MSDALQSGLNPKLAVYGFGAGPNYIPKTCPPPKIKKHLQFQENQANALFKYDSAIAIGYLETRNEKGQNCNAIDYTDSTSASQARENAFMLKDYLNSIGSPLGNLTVIKVLRTANAGYNPILADATRPCGLKYSPVYVDIKFVQDQPSPL